MSRYRINIKTLENRILTFHVDKYVICDGDFVEFLDAKTNITKKFHSSNCEITEIKEGDS